MVTHPSMRRAALVVSRAMTGAFGAALVLNLVGGLNAPMARAAAANGGAAQVLVPNGQPGAGSPLNAGGSSTAFTLKLPAGAACSGDTTAGYHVQSYMVNGSVDPATLTFDGGGPTPQSTGAPFQEPLWKTSHQAYVNAATNSASTPGGPGDIINIPNFDFSVYQASDIPAGPYNVGIACTNGPAGPSQLDKYWNVVFTFAASNSDPKGFSWTVSQSTTTTTNPTTTSTTAATGGGTTTSTTSASGASSTTSSTSTTVHTNATTTSTIASTVSTVRSTTATTDPTAVAGASTSLPRTGGGSRARTDALLAVFLLLCGRIAYLLARPIRPKGTNAR